MIRRRVNIEHTFDILPHEHVEAKVDEYALFVKEYNESEKYRLVFSFNPICSNVLFNTITEITQNEGSDECKLFNMNVNNALIQIDSTKDKDLYDYLTYTSRKDSNDKTTFLTKEKHNISCAEYVIVHFLDGNMSAVADEMDVILRKKREKYTSVQCVWGKVKKEEVSE